jgi:predicted flap endonuclease-1-like 5' DNA nuclease
MRRTYPPEECEFFITNAGVADTEEVEIPEAEGLDFELEEISQDKPDLESEVSTNGKELTDIKGIGSGTAENLKAEGINTVDDLLKANPKTISSKISGISDSMVEDWQKSAQT